MSYRRSSCEFRGSAPLALLPYLRLIVPVGNDYVIVQARRIHKELFEMSYRRLTGKALNQMVFCFPDDAPLIYATLCLCHIGASFLKRYAEVASADTFS